ncbi:MAG: TadE/TadG family type IV pilus assembly protein [Candidatus Tyrphobacter sp.]
MMRGQRGQAMMETALFLPVFLLVLFGVIWAVQSSVVGERAQIAVRFAGLVSDEVSPYDHYSLGSLYDGLPGIAQSETYSCSEPAPDALMNDGNFPGPVTPPFFQPQSGSTSGTCSQGETQLSGGSMTSPMIFVHTQSDITTGTSVPSYLSGVLGSFQNETAEQNFIDGPDVQTILTCYNDGTTDDLGTVVTDSLTDKTMDASAAPTPLPDIPNTSPLTVSSSC